jgi:catechol 2,3-dioxygenase-like lactoylglutathione lyase family enzyme
VQDTGLLGLHHIHLRAADPAEMFTWLLAKFGGERTKLKGQIDTVKYSAAGFSDMWVLVQRGESTPSDGHAIDHIGWRATNLVEKIAALKAAGVKVLTEPRPLTLADKTTIQFAYVEGPAGTKIELVQRPR